MKKRPNSIKRHTISFKYAFEGLFHTIKTQPNLRIHLSIAFLVTVMGILLKLNYIEWLIILFTFLWVIVSEMINTAIESVVDLITTTKHVEAKIAKDVSAGMVLVGAMGSIIIGIVIFLPKIIKLF